MTAIKSARDPVCGMAVDPHATAYRAKHAGHPYYFCSAGCRARFVADPGNYLAPEADRPATPVAEGAVYTCPMHPQIRQVGPGVCPICGMALEPLIATGDAPTDPELADFTRRFRAGAALAAVVLVLEMGRHMLGLDRVLLASVSNRLQLVLATPVVLCGRAGRSSSAAGVRSSRATSTCSP